MDVLNTLKDLIAIPSVNPMRADSGEAAERAAIDCLESLLRSEQIDCERQAVVDGRENLIAVVHATGRVNFGRSALELPHRYGPSGQHGHLSL